MCTIAKLRITFKIFFLFGIFVALFSCKKYLDIAPPKTQLVNAAVFESDATATSALTSIYGKMMTEQLTYNIPLYSGLSSDEFQNYSLSQDLKQLYGNSLNAQNTSVQNLWNFAYNYIYQANAIVEGVSNSSTISSSVKRQLIGEAKFLRSFWHFYLVNLFGDIPIITTTNYEVNSKITRATRNLVYQQIIKDLLEADNLLNSNFVDASDTVITTERIRPTKWAAKTLLARVYLYNKDYNSAKKFASEVLSNTTLFNLLDNLDDVFSKNNSEAILQLQPVVPGFNTFEGAFFPIINSPGSGTINCSVLTRTLVNSFEANDKRKKNWIGSTISSTDTFYFPLKYKIQNSSDLIEYTTVFRVAELYLIRAEAETQLDDLTGANADLNVIRKRAGLGALNEGVKTNLMLLIEQERKVEFFSEWGHRWFDLNRLPAVSMVGKTRADEVLNIVKTNWKSTASLFPIPQKERENNANLSQNFGY